MRPFAVVTVVFSLLIAADGQYETAAAAGAICTPRERDALLAFKEGVTDDPEGRLSSWQHDDDCCRWRGVRCSNQTGHVLKLRLADAGLVGQISRSLLSLERLRHLDLSFNYLEGPRGQMPAFLGSFQSLKYLDLSGIPFAGTVPPQLGNLSKLQYLDLSGLHMHTTDMSWLTHISFLRHLNLNAINLSAIDEWPHVINMLPSLSFLSLSYCSLTSANQSLPHLNLTKLEKLDLSENHFHQQIASCWFWNLTSLTELLLSWNSLYGHLPNSLGDMTSLQVLDISYNNRCHANLAADFRKLCSLEILDLSGSFPSVDLTELLESLAQCSKLQELHLAWNNISGNLPNVMGMFASLVSLDLYTNHLTGTLPNWMGKLSSLVSLDLSTNNLTGHVPLEIGMLTNLTTLDLSQNHLDGEITEKHFAHLTSLKSIDLRFNNLKFVVPPQWVPPFRLETAEFSSCQMGPKFPTWLQSQGDIEVLSMINCSIKDTLPHWFWTTFSKAGYLGLSNNEIVGRLPTSMENMPLENLLFASNQISGQIPQLPTKLTILDMSENHLSGPLPSNFGAPYLAQLFLFNNRLSGHIPRSIGELGLYFLDLGNNLFEGELPESFQTTMGVLRLSNNSLSGTFPSFLRDCTSLSFLDLSRNKFSGRLPTWIGNFKDLQILRLRDNDFSGNIPVSITELEKLHHLDLSGNSISGALPRNLSKIMAMKGNETHIAGPMFVDYTSDVTMKRQDRPYDESKVEVVTIDLAANCLTGDIPEEIVLLVALVNVNLSRNYLTGKIPNNIGALKSLLSLDLSHNKLSKAIPSSMSNLTYLSYLDLSYNNLTGRIPSGSQLDTLYEQYPYMYDGNSGLCGHPLPKNCSAAMSPPTSSHSRRTGRDFQPEPLYVGLVLGFIAGLWLVFCTLLFKKAWRIAYFGLFDKMHDKMYVYVVVAWARLKQKTDGN